jgi:MFS family permease
MRLGRVVSALAVAVRNENVRRVELAWGAVIAAEWAHFVALGVFAFQEGGASAVGIAGLARLLPAALVAPFAAPLGDRFPRERFLLGMSLVGLCALAGSAVAAYAGEPVSVFVLAGVVGLSSTLFRPALQALLPSLARTPEELISANAATSTIESAGTLVGPLLAGALLSFGDIGLVFAVASGAFLVASILLARVDVEGRLVLTSGTGDKGLWRMFAAGFEAIARVASARLVVGLIVAQTFVRGCLNVLIVVAAFQVFDGGAAEVGYLTAAIGLGGLIGALWAMALEGRRLAVIFGIALVFWGVPMMLIAPRPDLVAAILLLAILGAANSIEDVAAFTLLQRIVPDRILTRALGVLWGLAMGGVALGSIAAPPIVDALGPRAAFLVVGSILPILALVTYRRLVEIDRTEAPAPELELIEQVPMFAPLSVAAKERVAASLVPVRVSAGEPVIRAGDTGDRFYIVAGGELQIDAGSRRASAQRTDYFGEIALLRDVPRTATVTAVVDSELFALQRDDFLAAVTGHSAAQEAGKAVVEARLAATHDAGAGTRR